MVVKGSTSDRRETLCLLLYKTSASSRPACRAGPGRRTTRIFFGLSSSNAALGLRILKECQLQGVIYGYVGILR